MGVGRVGGGGGEGSECSGAQGVWHSNFGVGVCSLGLLDVWATELGVWGLGFRVRRV